MNGDAGFFYKTNYSFSTMQLNTQTYGTDDNPPLIMIHGLFGSGKLWRIFALKFAKHYWVHTPDLRNHGQSPHTDSMTYEEMAGDIADYMDEMGIEKAHILGHSMGGKVAMQFALNWPERVDKLIVEDIAPMYYKPRHEAVIEGIKVINSVNLESRSHADTLVEDIIEDKGLRLFLYTNLSKQPSGYLDWHINMDAILDNYEEISRAPVYKKKPYSCTTLFLKGGDSQYILDEYRRKIKEWFPLSRINTVKGAGHWLHTDQPDTFLDICLKFYSHEQPALGRDDSAGLLQQA